MPHHLIIPDLLWPAALTPNPSGGLALPALESILGRARLETAPPQSLERCLGELFGLASGPLPHAAIRRAGEAQVAPGGGAVLCADPVNLHFAREHLLLADASGLEISTAQAAQIVDGLNETFSDVGRFEAAAPDRWYLWIAALPELSFTPLAEVAGRPMGPFMPEGPDSREWHRLSNEIQVWLHNHPVNAAREAAGLRPINSLWFWGAGAPPGTLRSPAAIVHAEGTLARGLATLAGVAPSCAEHLDAAAGSDVLAVLERLQLQARYLNLTDWRTELAAIERDWLAPALEALKAGHIDELRITAPCERATLRLTLRAGGWRHFWKRPRALDTLHKSIA